MTDLDDFDLSGRDPSVDAGIEPASLGTLLVHEGLQLSERSGEDRLEAYVTPDRRDDVRLRGYVVVPLATPDGTQAQLFCRIERLRYAHEFATDDATAIHVQRAMDRDGIDERDYRFIASLYPIATVIGDPGDPEATLARRTPDMLPKPETTVREAVYDGEIKTGLKLPREGLFVGHLAVGGERVITAATPPTVDYRLRDQSVVDPLVFRHVLVAGGTGSGKTHAAKNVLRQLLGGDRRYRLGDLDRRPALVVIDPQDEYAQLREDNPDLDEEVRRGWDRESIAYGGVEETTVFVPDIEGTSYAANNHRAEQLRFTLPFAIVRRYPWLIAGAGLNEIQFNALSDLVREYWTQTSAEPTYAGFIAHLEEADVRDRAIAGGRIHESTYEAVYRRVKRAAFYRAFDQGAKPITDLIDRFVVPGGISTVPTYHLEDDTQRRLVVLAVSALLVDEKLTSDPTYGRIKSTPIVLAMDEAHNYLAAAESVLADRTVRKFTEAAKQGRKERLGLFLITQDPDDIADPIRMQINTKIALNLADDEAISSLNLDRRLERQVPDLERGQMVIHSPDNAEAVQVIGLRRCVVKHVPR